MEVIKQKLILETVCLILILKFFNMESLRIHTYPSYLSQSPSLLQITSHFIHINKGIPSKVIQKVIFRDPILFRKSMSIPLGRLDLPVTHVTVNSNNKSKHRLRNDESQTTFLILLIVVYLRTILQS